MKSSTLRKVKHMNNYQIAEEGRANARSEGQPLTGCLDILCVTKLDGRTHPAEEYMALPVRDIVYGRLLEIKSESHFSCSFSSSLVGCLQHFHSYVMFNGQFVCVCNELSIPECAFAMGNP